mgnify:CR=1 FL=1
MSVVVSEAGLEELVVYAPREFEDVVKRIFEKLGVKARVVTELPEEGDGIVAVLSIDPLIDSMIKKDVMSRGFRVWLLKPEDLIFQDF